jgi:hypothetical protein
VCVGTRDRLNVTLTDIDVSVNLTRFPPTKGGTIRTAKPPGGQNAYGFLAAKVLRKVLEQCGASKQGRGRTHRDERKTDHPAN